jgi:hypothetical protein
VFPGAAVSLYPVNKFGIERLFATILAGDIPPLTDFSANRKTRTQSIKAGVNVGLLQLAIEDAQ